MPISIAVSFSNKAWSVRVEWLYGLSYRTGGFATKQEAIAFGMMDYIPCAGVQV